MADVGHVELRAQLEEERTTLVAQLEELGVGGAGPDYDSNFADTSQVTAERGENEALAAALQETLGEVDHALSKFESGAYGTCESCGTEIPPARLEAMPATRFCIECAAGRR